MYEYEVNNSSQNNAEANTKSSSVKENKVVNPTVAYALDEPPVKSGAKPKKKNPNRGKTVGKFVLAVTLGLTFGVVAALGFVGATRIVNKFFPERHITAGNTKEGDRIIGNKADVAKPENVVGSTPVVRSAPESPEMQQAKAVVGMDVSQIVSNAMPSIVSITNKSIQEVRSMFGMGIQQYESESAGSGIIIGQNDTEILIVTNAHVVANAKTLTVGFVDEEVYTADVKGAEPDLDLAIISVKIDSLKKDTLDSIKVAVVGDSDKLLVGEQVVAIGNALGYGQSVTTGIISALERDHSDDNIDNPLLQTDAAINPGNSGGALLNMRGELVGINCAKTVSTSIEGIGYAIPVNSATPIIESIVSRQTREEVDEKDMGYIGITGVSVDEKTSNVYGVPVGVYIQNVEENSPAEAAGLIKTDVVRKFDGITVSSIKDIRDNLAYYKAGETVDLLIYRLVDGEYVEKTIPITLGGREGTTLDPANQKVDEDANAEENTPEDSAEDDAKEAEGNGDGLTDGDEGKTERYYGIPDDFFMNPFSIFGY